MNDLTPEQRAGWAQRLLDDELLTSVLAEMDADAVNAWRHSRPDDAVGRERAWQTVKAVERFREALRSRLTTGKLAAKRG